MAVSDLARRTNEVSAFLDACPPCPDCDGEDSTQSLLNSVPTFRNLIANNPEIRTQSFQKALELCLYDMVTDGESIDCFVEFGLWILHHCLNSDHTVFFKGLDEPKISEFLNGERFQYSIVRKRNCEVLIRRQNQTFCAKEWCSREGVLLCSVCLHCANRRVAYCSRDCQLSHWATHRRICGRDLEKAPEPIVEENRFITDSISSLY